MLKFHFMMYLIKMLRRMKILLKKLVEVAKLEVMSKAKNAKDKSVL